jgi:transcriptional antiterminator NusG
MSEVLARWYVLRVKARHERIAAEELRREGFDPFVPTYTDIRQWSDRVKRIELLLIPGYVFCRFLLENRIAILKTPGVTSIVSFGDQPASVSDEEMSWLRSIVASGLPARPCSYLQAGDRVRIEKGCLEGVSGILVCEKTSWRVVVSLQLLQRSVSVEMDRTMISAIKIPDVSDDSRDANTSVAHITQ